jgi:hypothetical protein
VPLVVAQLLRNGDVSPEQVVAAYVLAGCALGGALGVAGVVVGLLFGRRFREFPRVKDVATDWEVSFLGEGSLRRAECSFELDLFNANMLATGVRATSVVLVGAQGRSSTERLKDSGSKEPVWAIDLPPRRWVHVSSYAAFEGEGVRELEGLRRAVLVGRLLDGGTLELRIAGRGDFVASRKTGAPAGREE